MYCLTVILLMLVLPAGSAVIVSGGSYSLNS